MAYLFRMMRGMFYGPLSEVGIVMRTTRVALVDRMPLLMMICCQHLVRHFPRAYATTSFARAWIPFIGANHRSRRRFVTQVLPKTGAVLPVTFDLYALRLSDLLLMLPEMLGDHLALRRVDVWTSPCRDFRNSTIADLSVGGLVRTLACAFWFDAEDTSGTLFKGMFVLDRLAHLFQDFVVGRHESLVILISFDYVERFRFFKGEYYFLVMMSALGMMFMASANDLLSMFVTLEFFTFGFYVLVAYLREDLASNEAGLKFFILGVFAAALLAYGISLVYGETGKLIFSDMARHIARRRRWSSAWLLIFAAFGFKIGAVPLHSWIPDTYQGAPTPVTAFLSIAPKAAAFAILLRIFFSRCRR